MNVALDDVDRQILHLLQTDGRHNSNAAISDQVGLSPSTVGKRISRLEEAGVITGYRCEVDYELAGYPLHVLFTCTTSIEDRERAIQNVLEIRGVVSVRELMAGLENVHVLVVGRDTDDITRIAHELDGVGLEVGNETLLRSEYHRPGIS